MGDFGAGLPKDVGVEPRIGFPSFFLQGKLLKRREFVFVGGKVASWPGVFRGQQPSGPHRNARVSKVWFLGLAPNVAVPWNPTTPSHAQVGLLPLRASAVMLIANPSRAGSDPVVGQARRVLTKRDRAARYRGIGAAFDE